MRFTASRARGARPPRKPARPPGTPAAGVPRFLKATAAQPMGKPGDRFEHEADRAAQRLQAAPAASAPSAPKADLQAAPSPTAATTASTGRPLDPGTRARMEAHFGTDLSQVRTHTGSQAAALNRDLGARAFTQGRDIFFGHGQAPGPDALTAHELAHVVQQGGGARNAAGGPLSARGGPSPIQCSFIGSYPVAGNGVFEIDLETREGALATPIAASGLDGYIRFVPQAGAPNSNDITMVQIARLVDGGGADVPLGTLPAEQAQRGHLMQGGLRTADDAARGVEGGFFSDVWHPTGGGGMNAFNTPMSADFPVSPAGPGVPGVYGKVAQPAFYGGGRGGVPGQTRGFKRSDDAADIRSAALYDTPGINAATGRYDFSFESVARGNDTQFTYGAVTWGFGVHEGHVVDEHLSVQAGSSATFDEAMERHRDFYVHEPVTFYFDFDDARLAAGEAAKIDGFLPYLQRNSDVRLSLEGFADQAGGASAHNAQLSLDRALSVQAALVAHGVDAARIDPFILGHGASTAATPDAGRGDQHGNASLGADQTREANRWANRRVVLSFSHPGPAAAGAGP